MANFGTRPIPILLRAMMTCTIALAIALSSSAAQGDTERISFASDGSEGDGWSFWSSMSSDGRFVAFLSSATNLVPNDTNNAPDVFVLDRLTGQVERVSTASNGSQGTASSRAPRISANGRYVAYSSFAENLVTDDTNNFEDIFVHDRATGQTERVSLSSSGIEGNGISTSPSLSWDGRYVVFVSEANNLIGSDTNGVADIFVHDRATNTTDRVSVSSGGTEANGGSASPSISWDGSYVAFVSGANNIVSNDTNDVGDVFVHDRNTGESVRVSVASDGSQPNGSSLGPRISLDGGSIAFIAFANNLVPNDTNGLQDVFVHDRVSGQTRRVSIASDGTQSNDESWIPSLSSDGRFVAFHSTASNLVFGDTNGFDDVFVHDRLTGLTRRVSVASDGTQGNSGSSAWSSSLVNGFVTFSSAATNLVPGDTNSETDVFGHEIGVPATSGDCGTYGDVDGDQDGLCDSWEEHGIDIDGDGIPDVELWDMNGDGVIEPSEQADPFTPDVYLELDWMELHQPSGVAVDRVVQAFAEHGVRLHVMVDEQAIQHSEELAFEGCTSSAPSTVPDFDVVKQTSFGSSLERSLPQASFVLEAKQLVFHYGLFAHSLYQEGSTSGCAELGGNDLVVSLGGWRYPGLSGHPVGFVDHQSATLMHELGHNLGLHHGGGDEINCKPNYLSIMSYTRQFNGQFVFGRPLDYSDRQLATLREDDLDETVGIGGAQGDETAFGPPEVQRDVDASSGIDWDRDGDALDQGISRDLNFFDLVPGKPDPCDESPGQILVGHDDWAGLQFNFRTSVDFADGVHDTTINLHEITFEEAVTKSPDSDGDGVADLVDSCPITVNPAQIDSDSDGVGDACEIEQTFSDVPLDHWAWRYIEALVDAGLTAGYPDGTFRPGNQVTRAEMAVFIKKGIHGATYTPPTPDGSHPFSDITGHWAEAWMEDLHDEGMTTGYPDGTYRPASNVSRAEMAVFLLKAKHGSLYTPPAPSGGSFSDVAGHWAEAWIEQLAEEGITSGYPDGTFRPGNSVTRAEMAVFLVNAFGLAVP